MTILFVTKKIISTCIDEDDYFEKQIRLKLKKRPSLFHRHALRTKIFEVGGNGTNKIYKYNVNDNNHK